MEKKIKKKEWLPLRGAIALCREHGREITKGGLVYVGKEMGFMRKSADGFHWEWGRVGLREYLKDNVTPKGWISVVDFASKKYRGCVYV